MMNKQWILVIIGILLASIFIGWQISRYREPLVITYDVYIGTIGQPTCDLVADSQVQFNTTNTTYYFNAVYDICAAMALHKGELASILVERERNLIVSWQLIIT